VAKRLFGSFPYGRPIEGTPESLAKIDFADLRFAYDRLFGADNATIAITGNVNSDLAYRAARRYFGAWLKSDKRVPSTFRQPDTPDKSLQVLKMDAGTGASEFRHMIRGVSRSDADFSAAEVLAEILQGRLRARAGIDPGAAAFVRNDAHILPGSILFAVSNVRPESAAKIYPQTSESVDAPSLVSDLLSNAITVGEMQAAKAIVLNRLAADSLDDRWLDMDTYRIPDATAAIKSVESAAVADIQRVADRLKTQPAVSVWLVKGIG
jgi:zinc protease